MHSDRLLRIRSLMVISVLAVGIAACQAVGSDGTDSANGPEGAGETASSSTAASDTSDAAAAQLYDALAKAASEPKLHVAMYRETYATKADADARRDPGSIASSVSELDTTNGNYRSVFATNVLEHPGFSVGRCIDGTTYNDDYTRVNKGKRATSLENIAGHLKLLPEGHLYEVTQPVTFISCPHLGLMPQAPPDLAMARLSDGVFPVTLAPEQAQAWKQSVAAAALFTVRDEGMVEKDGRQLRQLSFAPKNEDDINQQLYDIFYEAAGIAQIEAEQPDAGWEHGFIGINPNNTGSVGGFYLIDEGKNLPVYSELYGTNPDKESGESPAAGRNIARTKQNYRFPAKLRLDLDSPLEFLD
jgi:hypothetical protein